MDVSSFDLNSFAIDSGGIPQAYYIPDFITEDEEAYLLRQIYNAPKPKWKVLGNRRLQVWGGDLTSSNKLFAQPLPAFLTDYPDIIGRLKSTGAFVDSKHGAPNHVIINEYLPLQGIMPHEDGPSYHPVVATISLRSHSVFHYYRYRPEAPSTISPTDSDPHDLTKINDEKSENDTNSSGMNNTNNGRGRAIDLSRPVLSVLLEPRSLVITTRELYTDHLHGIDPLSKDIFLPASSGTASSETPTEKSDSDSPYEYDKGVCVANWNMIKDPRLREVVENGGTLTRETRVSLTCRDVESVVNVKSRR